MPRRVSPGDPRRDQDRPTATTVLTLTNGVILTVVGAYATTRSTTVTLIATALSAVTVASYLLSRRG
jgi:hypothetical protein